MASGSGKTGSRVAVLMGGLSVEREVSLSTGRECAKALRVAGYDVVELDAGRDLAMQGIENAVRFDLLKAHGKIAARVKRDHLVPRHPQSIGAFAPC